ncbi:MAG: GNAT family N-acetyltransferase [Anaerolineaceae bacterium 4572_78]|nr:MAG: GNAT family N-acetyltransferase [Anaerolineaceae bacterium 4572_78]
MINYTYSIHSITPKQLHGFFIGWLNPPSPQIHLEILKNSDEIVLAIDGTTYHVVGFVAAHTDKILTASISLVEVLPSYQGQNIGQELVRRILERLQHLYAIDLICDLDVQPFYEKLDMKPCHGMMIRNYENQSGFIM